MSIIVEGRDVQLVVSPAAIVDGTSHDMAWAEKHVQPNPALAWIIAKYVEADRANSNTQMWTLGDLREYRSTINHSPLNMLHRDRDVVGTIVANELIYSKDAAEEDGVDNAPFIETLAAFWKYYRQDEYALVKKSHDAGNLFISMECVAKTITCHGDSGCGQDFDYAGAESDTYCEHLQKRTSVRRMNQPHFLGGGLILPPTRPGWKNAEVTDISSLVKHYREQSEQVYADVAVEVPHLGPKEWEGLMGSIMAMVLDKGREFKADERKKLAGKNAALPDGSYPTPTLSSLMDAIQAFGRADTGKRPALKRYLLRRARALGASEEVVDRIKALEA